MVFAFSELTPRTHFNQVAQILDIVKASVLLLIEEKKSYVK